MSRRFGAGSQLAFAAAIDTESPRSDEVTTVPGVQLRNKRRRSKPVTVAVGISVADVPDAIARLKQWRDEATWPDDPAVLAGAGKADRTPPSTPLWHVRRLTDDVAGAAAAAFSDWFEADAVKVQMDEGPSVSLDVVEALGADTLVVRATDAEQLALRKNFPGLNLTLDGGAYPMWVTITGLEGDGPTEVAPEDGGKKITVYVSADGKPLGDIHTRVQYAKGSYVDGQTEASGFCVLTLPKVVSANVTVFVLPKHTYWDSVQVVPLASASTGVVKVELAKLTPTWIQGFAHILGEFGEADGAGVKIGVLDTGVAPHDQLKVAGGASTVVGETDNLNYLDTVGHGTMVAGVIAATGDGVTTARGVAPAAEIHAYRVFPPNSVRADEVAIGKAVRLAVDDGCDILNISLGSVRSMIAVQREMSYATSKGVVCIVAAGNGGRRPVQYPACYPEAVAVSAMGRLSTYPAGCTFSLSETTDGGTDELDYLSNFTNVGETVDVCAPGVAVVSTLPGNRLGVSKGTSFSAPIITGLLARALSTKTAFDILHTPDRNAARTEAMKQLVTVAAKRFGFAVDQSEGHGMPR